MAFYRICIFLVALCACGSCWWPFSSSDDDPEPALIEGTAEQLADKRATPFEITSAEQKFLAEAQQFLDMSPLDRCQHLVISRLRGSCGDLDEEELGKLSVALLNCQSQAEGRQTFACSDDMSLAECTGSMDAHMWNTYHIISNRARSVCYSTRQQQFRRQTELAVNKLSQSTLEQLGAVQELASSHEEIRSLAHESLSSLQSSQVELSERQKEVLASQAGLTENINTNLEQLTHEKAMINLGQQRLANMTEAIHQQLEVASSLLEDQEELRRQSHSEILGDITSVRENIQNVWERVDNSTSQLLGVMEDISHQYESTLENLKLINSSVSSMMNLVVSMDTALSEQLDWLITQLGGTQDGLRILTTFASHAAFLLAATLCVLFIKAPGFARISLLVMVVANAIFEVKYRVSLNLYALAVLEMVVVMGNCVYLWWRNPSGLKKGGHTPYYLLPSPGAGDGTLSPTQLDPIPVARQPAASQKTHFDSTPLNSEDDESGDEEFGYRGYDAKPAETLTHTPTKHTPHTPTRLTTLTTFTPSTTPRASLAGGGRQCVSRTKSGLQCKLGATVGSVYCRHHGNH